MCKNPKFLFVPDPFGENCSRLELTHAEHSTNVSYNHEKKRVLNRHCEWLQWIKCTSNVQIKEL